MHLLDLTTDSLERHPTDGQDVKNPPFRIDNHRTLGIKRGLRTQQLTIHDQIRT